MSADRFPDRLNPTDATLWDIKRDPLLRTTIVAVALLDRQPDWNQLCATIERAVEGLPRLRQRVTEGPLGFGRPFWVETEVDIGFHVRHIGASASGSLRGALDLAGDLAGEEFDPARPLWEIVLVDGLEEGRSALLLKVSHALTDGVGGVRLLRCFDDTSGEEVLASLIERGEDQPEATPWDGFRKLVHAPTSLLTTAIEAGLHPLHTVETATAAASSTTRMLSPTGPPLSSLMTERSVDRWLGLAEVPIESLQRAAHRADGTINDAFVTIALGALSDHHRALGADDTRFRITMPVNFRSDRDAHGGNQWTPARVVLDVDPLLHPYDQLQRHRLRLRAAADEPSVGFSQTIAAGVQQLPPIFTVGVVAGMVKGSDIVLTDIPGTAEPLRIAGAKVERLYPYAPAGGAALSIGLMSHLDTACFGFNVDRAAVPVPQRLVEHFENRTQDFLRRRRAPRPRVPLAPPEPAAVEQRTHERLSGLDTSFLRMETAATPMHMGGLFVMNESALIDDDGAFDLESVTRHIRHRLERAPRMMRRVEEVPLELGRPVWVEDNFDISRHVHHRTLPAPGTRTQLLELCETIQMELLDRQHALFDFTFITGLDPEEFGPGTIAMVERIHHSLLDGMSGVELLAVIFDIEPNPQQEELPIHEHSTGIDVHETTTWLVAEAMGDLMKEAVAISKAALHAVRSPRRMAEHLGTLAGAYDDMVVALGANPPSLNQPVGGFRRLLPLTVSLSDVHDAAAARGGTVNDLVLTAISSGLRALLLSRGESVDRPITAMVPVSTRSAGLGEDRGNHMSALIAALPVMEPDLDVAFTEVTQEMTHLKQDHHADGTEIIMEAGDHIPPIALDAIPRLAGQQPFVNLIITNLPGPPIPLFFMASEVTEMVPIVPLGGNLTVNVAILSYVDDLIIALHADADACSDLEVMADATMTAFTS